MADQTGGGWFYAHVHAVERFIFQHPDDVRKNIAEKAALPKAIPPEILERTHTGYGVIRYRVKREYLSCYLF